MISKASENASRNAVVKRLSGGDMNVRRYTFSAGEVHSKEPPVAMGTLNRDMITAWVSGVFLEYIILGREISPGLVGGLEVVQVESMHGWPS